MLDTLIHLCEKRPPVFRVRMVAALCDKRGRLISLGFNSYKTHPIAKKYIPRSEYLHAETDAILKAKRENFTDWEKATLFVARVKKEGPENKRVFVSGLAEPCPECKNMIADFKIGKVLFTK